MSSTIRKLSTFRKLSLNCDSPPPTAVQNRTRHSLKKQFSEDLSATEAKKWLDPSNFNNTINFPVSEKSSRRNLDRPPPPVVKIAWDDDPIEKSVDFQNFINPEEAVIIKKLKEVRRVPTAKLTRHSSLENDSLFPKTEIPIKLHDGKNKENEKSKMNLKIILSHTTKDKDECTEFIEKMEKSTSNKPKFIEPLISTNSNKIIHQIKRNNHRINSSKFVPLSPKVVENEQVNKVDRNIEKFVENLKPLEEPKAINNVIIRPATAASKREMFQKRTNSAFNDTVKETIRPRLMRSLSAPTNKEKPKFPATKRRIKTAKKHTAQNKNQNNKTDFTRNDNGLHKDNSIITKDVPISESGAEIVTMVSLVSPAGSDNEEIDEDDKKEQNISSPKKSVLAKGPCGKDVATKNISLRKVGKSVSFQQSTIHAIRSFSASFPSRRNSLASGFLNKNNNSTFMPKSQEKRNTNPSSNEEKNPKRRLHNIDSFSSVPIDKSQTDPSTESECESEIFEENISANSASKVTISTKPPGSDQREEKKSEEIEENSNKDLSIINIQQSDIIVHSDKNDSNNENVGNITTPTQESSDKEKQCWTMYQKMTGKGINVSFDTILRGMLTPTEYRLSRIKSFAEENKEKNQSNEEDKFLVK